VVGSQIIRCNCAESAATEPKPSMSAEEFWRTRYPFQTFQQIGGEHYDAVFKFAEAYSQQVLLAKLGDPAPAKEAGK
jgi:hypothetical protein